MTQASVGDIGSERASARTEAMNSCIPSDREGFDCSQEVGSVTMHWKVVNDANGDPSSVRLLVQALTGGWISAGFPKPPGSGMVGAMVVQGSPKGIRQVELDGYLASSFKPAVIDGISDVEVSRNGGTTTLSMTLGSPINITKPLDMIAAYNSASDNLNISHSSNTRHSGVLNFMGGGLVSLPADQTPPITSEPTPADSERCAPSNLEGYDCSQVVDFSTLHWAVVNNANGEPFSVNVAITQVTSTPGWISMGFPISSGSGMIGGRAVQASSEGIRQVVLTSYSANAFTNTTIEGVSNPSYRRDGDMTTLAMTLSSPIDINKPVSMIIAANPSSADLTTAHPPSMRHPFEFNFLSGSSSVEASPKQPLWLSHGATMFIGWGLMIPAGVTAASSFRHHDPAWFQAHRYMNSAGLLVALVGLIIALAGLAPFGSSEKIVMSHGVIGLVVMCLGFIQPVMAYFRPHKGDPARVYFNFAHWAVGGTAVALGLINITTGTYILELLAPGRFTWVMCTWFAYLALALLTWVVLRIVRGTVWSKQATKDRVEKQPAHAQVGGQGLVNKAHPV